MALRSLLSASRIPILLWSSLTSTSTEAGSLVLFSALILWSSSSYPNLTQSLFYNWVSWELTKLINRGGQMWIFFVTFYPSWGWRRSSRRAVVCREGVLKNFAKFTGKHLCQNLFLIKLQGSATLLKKRFWQDVFLWILRNFQEHLFLLNTRWLLMLEYRLRKKEVIRYWLV